MTFFFILISFVLMIFFGSWFYVLHEKESLKQVKAKLEYDILSDEERDEVDGILFEISALCVFGFLLGLAIFIIVLLN